MILRRNALIAISIWIASCSPQPIDNQKEIKEEIDNREIRRITKVQILEEATDKGNQLTKLLNKALIDSSYSTVLVDSLSRAFSVDIKLVSQNNPPTEGTMESELLEAYQYAVENNLKTEPNVQDLEDGIVFYTSPILNKHILTDSSGLYGAWNLGFSKKEMILNME